jgi:hypothetical protein
MMHVWMIMYVVVQQFFWYHIYDSLNYLKSFSESSYMYFMIPNYPNVVFCCIKQIV